MKQIWAPWRIDYILGPKPDECVFCLPETEKEDENRLVLHRGKHCFVIMNRYPYTYGHLMVCPYRHVQQLSDLDTETTHEIMRYLTFTAGLLTKVLGCAGINIGLNLGEAAGAGIREHMHFHLVPRFEGDTTLTASPETARTMTGYLEKTYKKLKPHFANAPTER